MAWLAGLADKAGNLLDKIDKNTAAALKNDENNFEQDFTEISVTENRVLSTSLQFPKSDAEDFSIKTDPGIYLAPEMEKDSSVLQVPFNDTMKRSESADFHVESSLSSGRSSPGSAHLSINIPISENYHLLNDESQKEAAFDAIQHEQNFIPKIPSKNVEKSEFVTREQAEKDANDFREKVATLIIEKEQLYKEISDLRSSLDRNRLELDRTRSDLEQHKARASRTLQEKEKLIAELRNNTNSEMDDVAFMEINQLRQERKILQEENRQISEQLRATRQELLGAEVKLEKMRQQSIESNMHAQESIITERKRRLDAEEDAKLHIEEIRSMKEELSLLRNKFSTKSRRLETEISRLRTQLSAMSTPSTEVESRLTTLTQTLVSKQQALENLTTERNALRLQLEKMEQKYRSVSDWGKNSSFDNVNDTDDVKAQMPAFLIETPFDTTVTRRMKRAYSILDTISIRTGVFLRRYPLARILILIYMVLLHFWVLIVLFSQSPEAH